jgi:hypothetical protein
MSAVAAADAAADEVVTTAVAALTEAAAATKAAGTTKGVGATEGSRATEGAVTKMATAVAWQQVVL